MRKFSLLQASFDQSRAHRQDGLQQQTLPLATQLVNTELLMADNHKSHYFSSGFDCLFSEMARNRKTEELRTGK